MAGANRFQLTQRIRAMLAERPVSLYEVMRELEDEDYRTILQAWGDLRTEVALIPDDRGRYRLPDGPSSVGG